MDALCTTLKLSVLLQYMTLAVLYIHLIHDSRFVLDLHMSIAICIDICIDLPNFTQIIPPRRSYDII